MKTKSLQRFPRLIWTFLMVFIWTTFSLNAQCPTVTNTTPPPICDAAGYTFSDLSADYTTDGGNGIVWYDADSGGNLINNNQLVEAGTYYADDNSGTCGTRESIVVTFQVGATGENFDQIYCSNENATVQTYIDDVLSSEIPSGGSVELYNDAALTDQANPSDALPGGAKSYYIVFVDNSGCKSQIEVGQVGVFDAPENPTPASPQTFCSDANPTIADINTGTTETNYSWYANVDGSGEPIPPALSNATVLVDGSTYYIQINSFFCTSDAVGVTVEVYDPVDAGSSGALEYCNDNLPPAFNLFDELGGTPETTGTWSGPLSTSNGYQGTVDISSLTTAGDYVFTYNVLSNNDCPDSTATITITINETLSAGNASGANPASFCVSNLPTNFDLFTLLENHDIGGSWTQGTLMTDPVVTTPIDLSGYTSGTYNFTYWQNVAPNPCPQDSTTVQVIVLEDPNAGVAINQVFCENELSANSPFNLFDALDGSQDHDSGTWTDVSDNTISSNLDLTILTVAGSPYTFNYTIDNGTCSDTEPITITIEEAPESGTANAPAEFCEGAAPTSYNLFDLLEGEDQTGTWSDDNASGVLTGNTVDLSGLTPGTYNFTFNVDAVGSCDDVNVTVSIVINPLPNAGTPTPATFCENDLASNSPLDLFNQLSGEDAGGTWNDDDTTRALSGSNLDLTALSIGTYNFTYTVTNSFSCTDSSTVSISVVEAPESGTANAPVQFCLAEITTGQTYNLFDLLEDEDQTGTWSDDNASGALTDNIVSIDALSVGTYNFTFDVDAIGSCDDVNVTVSIVVSETTAPTANATQDFCDSATVADLVATGDGIQWYISNTGGTALSTTTDLTSGQTYYASQTDATTGCESATRTEVTVTIYNSPNAGDFGTSAIISCNNNASIDLFTGLDGSQDTGGTWNNDDNVGSLSGSIFDASGIAGGIYEFTYTVAATAPCSSDSITIQVTIEEPLNAGTDGTPLDLCSNNGTVDLFSELGGTPETGGIWTPALASGTGVFDPLVDAPGTYMYSLSNVCGTASSSIDVSVTLAPNAGSDDSIALCTSDDAVDLFDLLGADAQSGGSWSPTLTSGTGVFDPAVDAADVYTYTVLATSPCSPDAEASITVTVNETPTPTTSNNAPEFCAVDEPVVSNLDDFITSTGTIQWYEDAALTISLTGTEALADGDYYATQTNSTGCASAQAVQLTVTINDAETPSLTNPNEEYCLNDGPTISTLTNNLTYNTNIYDVVWYDSETGGSTLSSSTEISDSTYYAALVDLNTGCEGSERLAVSPNTTACGKVELPDGFSPNGDGVNDTFDVDNLAILYPNFEIEVYNRNGNVVYKGNASTPRFDGTANQSRVVVKGDLPVGVYFYIFKYNDGEHDPQQGRLYLSR